jgi:hypothetical protein
MAPIPKAPGGKKLFTPAQIANIAIQVWGEEQATTAVAVALAESGGDAYKDNKGLNVDGSTDWGMWQINDRAHPNLAGWDNWYDATTNARMAKQVYDDRARTGRNGWSAWSAYTSGAYKTHIPAAQAGVSQPSGTAGGDDQTTQEAEWFRDTKDVMGQIANGISAMAQVVWKAMVWMANPHNWVRAAFVLTGGAMAVGAIVVAVKPNKSVGQAVTAAPRKIVSTVKAA